MFGKYYVVGSSTLQSWTYPTCLLDHIRLTWYSCRCCYYVYKVIDAVMAHLAIGALPIIDHPMEVMADGSIYVPIFFSFLVSSISLIWNKNMFCFATNLKVYLVRRWCISVCQKKLTLHKYVFLIKIHLENFCTSLLFVILSRPSTFRKLLYFSVVCNSF